MTLIGGFRCNLGVPGGVVLCADSYEGDGITKSQTDKVVEYRSDWCTAGFVGAGQDANVIDATVQRIIEEFEDFKPDNEASIKSAIRSALRDLPETRNPANLLMAVSPVSDPTSRLWEIADRHLRNVTTGYAVRGIGSVIQFVADQFYRRISLYEGVLLSAHLLRLGIKYVDGVEGPSRVLVLTDGGWLVPEPLDKIEQHEKVFRQFENALSSIYLPFGDTSIPKEVFDYSVDQFADTIKTLRANHFDEFKDAHLSMAIKLAEDGMYEGDPYRTLPDNARTQVGYVGVTYKFEESPEGASGVASPEQKKMARQVTQSPAKKIAKYKHTDEGGGDVSLSSSPSASPEDAESDEDV